MSKKHSPAAQRFLGHLERARELRSEVAAAGELAAEHLTLSRWQAGRLAATYTDLAAQRRYRLAIEFFLSDLYGAKDFAQRDTDLVRIYPIMSRMLTENALESLALAVELHALTQELDSELIQAIQAKGVDIGAQPEALDQRLYAWAYRECDNRERRERQIQLIGETGRMLDEVVRHRFVFVAVRLLHGPAHAAGFGELHDFIERGLRAFKQMKGAKHFLHTIDQRERLILEQIYTGGTLTDWSAAALSDQPHRSPIA